MEVISKDKRDLIKTKNGYFKYLLSGAYSPNNAITAGHDCHFTFKLPPLNEMGFSDQYNQCLIQFKSITLQSGSSGANGNYGENATWYNKNGGSSPANSGLVLTTDIPCRNQTHISNQENTWATESQYSQTLHQKLNNEILSQLYADATAVDGSLNFLGTKENLKLGTTPTDTASARFQVNSKNVWSYETDRSIWDGGTLCGVPLGQEVKFEIKNIYNNAILALSSAPGHAEGSLTNLTCELEIQLLPNPTPKN